MICGACQTHRYLRRAWAPRKPFRALYCTNCGQVYLDLPALIEPLWMFFVAPFWSGAVRIER